MKLSVVVPSIRFLGIPALYDSIMDSFEDTFELIVIGPTSVMWPLSSCDNIKFIKSYRSPNAAQQQGLLQATGDYITFAADDGVFLPGALDMAFESLMWVNGSDILSGKEIVVGKYLEGNNPVNMESKDYYKFKYHKAYRLPGVPQENLIFNCGIISREFMLELGGWDAQNFDCTTVAHADIGIRACSAGGEMILMDKPMFQCSHLPGNTGDHGPINRATKRDLKNFAKIYERTEDRIHIPLDNWEKTEPIWKERFK